uniref:RxLR effector protein n=1 Tax=Phytophthora agathidicida TaxID=1642459 RepID=A0A7G4WI60_9STRA|nr:PaRXLR71 [Phytophthora agathidicida]
MRWFWISLPIAASFLVNGDAVVATTDSKLITAYKIDIPAKRALRAHTKSTEDDEERGIIDVITGVAPKALLNDEQLVAFAKNGATLDNVFTKLQLNGGIHKILDEANLGAFAKYVRIFDPNNPSQTLISTIIKKYGEVRVAKYLIEAKEFESSKNLAQHLQAAQFVSWMKANKTPDDVWQMFGLAHKTSYTNPYHHIWWDFVVARSKVLSNPKKYADALPSTYFFGLT